METVIKLINEVGFPIAAALGLGMFIWKLINRIIDGLETKVDTLDDKLVEQIAHDAVYPFPAEIAEVVAVMLSLPQSLLAFISSRC